MHEVSWSDDRRWFGNSLREVAWVAEQAHRLPLDACAPSSHSRFEYTHLRLQPDGTVACVLGEVFSYGGVARATADPPVLVGVPLCAEATAEIR